MRKIIIAIFILFSTVASSYADRTFTVTGDKDLPVEFTLTVDAVGSFDIRFMDNEENDMNVITLDVNDSLMVAKNAENSLFLKCDIISSSSYTVLMSISSMESQSGASVDSIDWSLLIGGKTINSTDVTASEVVKHLSGEQTDEFLPIDITVPLSAGVAGLYTGSISVTMRLDG